MRIALAACVALIAVGYGLVAVSWGADLATERVSVSTGGVEASANSLHPSLSGDGRYVAFESDSLNLVANDSNARDIFVHDRQAGTTELVSLASDGSQANRPALFPAISGDGRYVVYQSEADNLVPGDTNGASDVFVRDRQAGVTERVSVAGNGTQGDGDSLTPSISADGRYVTFTSLATILVADDTNGDRDVFLHDRLTGVTELVSVASGGTQGNSASGGLGAGPARVSGDGRYVVFGSFADNLVPDDTNLADDVFLRDRQSGVTERVSIDNSGAEGNEHSMYGDVSDDGRYVVFHSLADNLVGGDTNAAGDAFLRDRQTGTTVRLSDGIGGAEADGPSDFAVISADGGSVVFQSGATNLVADDTNAATDIFLSDHAGTAPQRISLGTNDTESDGDSSSAAISADGGVVAYQSLATNLVVGDTNGVTDIFVWGKPLLAPATPTPPGTPEPTATPTPAIDSGDVDCSGSVNSIDAALVLQLSANLIATLSCLEAADVNGSGAVDAIDAALILQFVAGFFSSLPP